jgi:anti-sigma B factor antagonist
MSSQTRQSWLEIEQLGDVTLVRFLLRDIVEEQMIQSLGSQLFALVEQENCRRLVLNFYRVERLGSAMLGKLRKLYDAMQAVDGRLAFCKLHPALEPGFDVLRLPRTLIFSEEQEALQAITSPGA